jgi:DNA-binding CsgD family transcriptional regulator
MQNSLQYECSETLFTIKQMERFLETTSAAAYWKDKKGHYLGSNQLMLLANNFKSEKDLLDNTDLDLWYQDQALIMMNNDQEISKRDKAKIYIESCHSHRTNHPVNYLSYKVPLRSGNGTIIGIFGLSFRMESETFITALNELGSLINPIILKKIAQRPQTNAAQLTPRQMDCLYCLVKGMTYKQIAKTLNLSPKTIEHYLDTIKLKLNCSNRSELINCALQMPMIKIRLLS